MAENQVRDGHESFITNDLTLNVEKAISKLMHFACKIVWTELTVAFWWNGPMPIGLTSAFLWSIQVVSSMACVARKVIEIVPIYLSITVLYFKWFTTVDSLRNIESIPKIQI